LSLIRRGCGQLEGVLAAQESSCQSAQMRSPAKRWGTAHAEFQQTLLGRADCPCGRPGGSPRSPAFRHRSMAAALTCGKGGRVSPVPTEPNVHAVRRRVRTPGSASRPATRLQRPGREGGRRAPSRFSCDPATKPPAPTDASSSSGPGPKRERFRQSPSRPTPTRNKGGPRHQGQVPGQRGDAPDAESGIRVISTMTLIMNALVSSTLRSLHVRGRARPVFAIVEDAGPDYPPASLQRAERRAPRTGLPCAGPAPSRRTRARRRPPHDLQNTVTRRSGYRSVPR